MYKRAKILLLKSDGMSNEAIADKLDMTVPTVRLCLENIVSQGFNPLLKMLLAVAARLEYLMIPKHGLSILNVRSLLLLVFI